MRQTTRIRTRSSRPSVKGTPAAFEPTTVAKALKVDPSVPMPQPSMITATPVTES